MNIQKLNNSVSPFAGISFANNSFNKSGISQLIDNELGRRVKTIGFDYSEILRNLSNVFLSGGGVIEDISTHLGEHLKMIPGNNVPSPDTVLRAIKELSTENTSFKSNSGIDYNFNINPRLNKLNFKVLLKTGQLMANHSYDFDYDNQVLANSKYDAKRTYKKNKGYLPGIATIGDKIVYVENRDGNANVKFEQAGTLSRAYKLLKSEGITVNRSRMDAGSYAKDIIDTVANNSKQFYIRANKSANLFEQITEISTWESVEINYKNYEVASILFKQFFEDRHYRLVIMREKSDSNQIDLFTQDAFVYRSILTNDWDSTEKEVVEYYNNRGTSEKIFDVMNNDFGWKHLPFSFLNENNAFMIITAMVKNFYNYFVAIVAKKFEGINLTTRLKRFVFRFITVAGKWVYQSRQWVLKLYSKLPYEQLIC
ncbi:MAG: IS1380 family transposase [Bacteroidetes bacterium]|nr:IS1380 family transposase [Bacteroidota bacterium]MBT4398430.1 IS1380 family transposase [Bacteroidota bacterium]MBT4411787.1 IS1380 family transposase [Bacteroidota bacterium]MBT4968742.1 IS1380 family transposase [Bacteroidota bacterium]MBT7095047.1 IS1380 family transposase [Bacteroidota bacterium]